jgi:hypothetical protein
VVVRVVGNWWYRGRAYLVVGSSVMERKETVRSQEILMMGDCGGGGKKKAGTVVADEQADG